MKALWKTLALVLVSSCISYQLQAQHHTMMAKADTVKHILLKSSDFKWGDAPSGLPKGARVAVLAGDPSKEGPFTVRLMFPANYEIKPHWHPTTENITVIKGTLYMGTQETFDKENATKLEEGSFALMPAKHVHYAFSKDPVTVQVYGMGPFVINYIKASDDPRTSTASQGLK